ncbi:metal transporter CNNM [Microdochium nivale]|nr:metal transporter CNNM [Microdochium nivale]
MAVSTSTANVFRIRTAVLGLAKAMFFGFAAAAPTSIVTPRDHHDNVPEVEGGPLWILFIISMVLVLAGGAFAGLTIALMGQDEIYLQVLSTDPEEPQRKNAKRVLDLLKRGKHWVLVTLLLSNVIVNETLPVVLDRCFGGGVAAVVGSTVLIVIFGEVLPQSVCVRYGLPIGGYASKPVLALMYFMSPIAWPIAKLLDWLLGEDHGTVYKKSGLKTLVTLHKSLGEIDERLNQDEVTIISAVLDLKRKAVEDVMTPMDDVYIMSEDTILDEKTIDEILDAGYSRIPIHQAGNPNNFVGMLLVKILITYDPEDCKKVKDFALATLPETRPETSCLDIINFFQEGKSHMVLISELPGEDHGALGVVTLEDVIEELIGEEIIDESDVYVDVHKAIRRAHPAPKARVARKENPIKENPAGDDDFVETENDVVDRTLGKRPSLGERPSQLLLSSSPRTTVLMRRSSAGHEGQLVRAAVPFKANYEEMMVHFKHLGPSNPAANPKSTRVAAVKIKPGVTHNPHSDAVAHADHAPENCHDADERTSLLRPAASNVDGANELQPSYGTPSAGESYADAVKLNVKPDETSNDTFRRQQESPTSSSTSAPFGGVERRTTKRLARSGSITENVIESDGIRKVVLELSSSSDEADSSVATSNNAKSSTSTNGSAGIHEEGASGQKTNKKKKKKAGKK